jgi:arylformamidase
MGEQMSAASASGKKIIDLTIGYSDDMIVAHEDDRPKFFLRDDYEAPDWYRMHTISHMYYHIGTHTDAPSHYIQGAKDIDDLDPQLFYGDAVILDISFRGADEAITLNDIKRAEEKLSTGIKPGDMILLMTQWSSRKWGNLEYYSHSPYLTRDPVEYLMTKKPRAFGYDFIHEQYSDLRRPEGVDELKRDVQIWRPVHSVVLGAGLYHVEHLINLEKINKERFEIVVAPALFHKKEGAPSRVFAIVAD